jgi:hypothetical protein
MVAIGQGYVMFEAFAQDGIEYIACRMAELKVSTRSGKAHGASNDFTPAHDQSVFARCFPL